VSQEKFRDGNKLSLRVTTGKTYIIHPKRKTKLSSIDRRSKEEFRPLNLDLKKDYGLSEKRMEEDLTQTGARRDDPIHI